MKTLISVLSALVVACCCAVFTVSCASSSNQRIGGTNKYYIFIVPDVVAATNIMGAISGNSVPRGTISPTNAVLDLSGVATGAKVIALDNMVIAGRNFGNASSNNVNGSMSIPLTF